MGFMGEISLMGLILRWEIVVSLLWLEKNVSE